MTSIISQLPVGVVKEIIDYCVFLEKDELETTMDNLMLEATFVFLYRDGLATKLNTNTIITKATEYSKNFEPYINIIGNLFGHSSIIEQPAFEIYKGPFLLKELSLVAYQNSYSNWTPPNNRVNLFIPHFLLHDLLQKNDKYELNEELAKTIALLKKDILPRTQELNKSLVVPYYSAASFPFKKCYYTLDELHNLLSQPLVRNQNRNLDVFLKGPIKQLGKVKNFITII